MREFIQHGVTGLLSPVKDPRTLRQNIYTIMIENDALRIQLAEACGRVVRS